jgi:hypothetical protein
LAAICVLPILLYMDRSLAHYFEIISPNVCYFTAISGLDFTTACHWNATQ